MGDKPSVHEALAAVIGELPAIGKDNKSPEGYQYRGIEAVTKQVQPLFAKHGVVITPKAEVISIVPSPAMKDGWQDVLLQVEWTITGPDGSTIVAQTNGMGRDRSDKGVNKAQTQAFKYLLLHVLCIADAKDDADSHTYEHDREERAVTPTADCPVCKEPLGTKPLKKRDGQTLHKACADKAITNDTAAPADSQQEATQQPLEPSGEPF